MKILLDLLNIKKNPVFYAFCILNIILISIHQLGYISSHLYIFVSIITSGLLGYIVGSVVRGIRRNK